MNKVEALIIEIEALDRAGCLDRWRESFGRPPPKYLSPQFMKRVLVWEAQTRVLGGISGKATPARARPGAHLVREWNGRIYQVEVVEGGLRSRPRKKADGAVSGGKPFNRGHIHHIPINPIYAGRIRHRKQVYDGQHPAIINPEVWDSVQEMLTREAQKARGTPRKAMLSPLAGKLFDETGDRLTPSHSRKKGRRLRYYISRRLVSDRSRKHPDAWRLPAEQLEALLANLIRKYLTKPDIAAQLLEGLSAAEMTQSAARLQQALDKGQCLSFIDRVDLRQGELTITLSRSELARVLSCDPDRINRARLTLETPFQMRRRGVKLKLHLGEAPQEIDRTLVQNIVRAQRWLAMILDGKTFSEIADAEGVSKRRVQDVVELALLAPDVLDAISEGTQPDGLTSDYLIKSGVPASWAEQRQRFAAL